MNQFPVPPAQRRHLWPWFVLGLFVLSILLAIFWMSAEVQRTRERRTQYISESTSAIVPAMPHGNSGPVAFPEREWLAEYRDALRGGDAVAGRKIFFEKPEANCGKCHKAGGQGGDNGPPLDGIGTKQTREFILESILYPNAVISTNYETVIVLLKNGGGTSGTIRGETDTELTLISADNESVRILKSDIQERMPGASPMPEGIWQLLTREELRNLIEFVVTLPTTP